MLKKGIAYFLLLIFTILLFACSKHAPAPVTTAGLYSPGNKGRLKQSHYTVKKGDTLYSIAWLANVDPNALAKFNKISSPFIIYEGQKLNLLLPKSKKVQKTSRVSKQNPAKHNKTTKRSANKSTKQKLQKDNKKTTLRQQSPKTVSKVAKNDHSHTKSVKNTNKKLDAKNNKPYSGHPKQIKKKHSNSDLVQWQRPTFGKIVSRFSNAETGNNGIDIVGKRGQAVVAAASGKVVYAGSALRGYGKLIIVKHNDDYLSAYAHNDKFHVKEQDIVKAGQRIADMGDSDAARVMLHFEIRHRGKSVNPELFLPK